MSESAHGHFQEERSGGEMELPASAASQSLEAAPRGMETAPRGLETAPPQSSQACSGGPSLDSTAEDLNNMSLDGDTPMYVFVCLVQM